MRTKNMNATKKRVVQKRGGSISDSGAKKEIRPDSKTIYTARNTRRNLREDSGNAEREDS